MDPVQTQSLNQEKLWKSKNPVNSKSKQLRNGGHSSLYESPNYRGHHSGQTNSFKFCRVDKRYMDNTIAMGPNKTDSVDQTSKWTKRRDVCDLIDSSKIDG